MRVGALRIDGNSARRDSSSALTNPVPALESAGVSWARFGDELFIFADEEEWGAVAAQPFVGLSANLREVRPPSRKEDLHLVIQHGRLFQQAHPTVPVLFDRGRFLVVELDEGKARAYAERGFTCWALEPLEANSVVFDMRRPGPAERAAPVAWVQSLVDLVSRARLEADLTHLVSFPNRFSTGAHFQAAAAWAARELSDMGYACRAEPVAVNGGASQNVIAEKRGVGGAPRRCVVITAHLDSINSRGGPAAPAPGADDNGSGSAGLLAMARALKDHDAVHDLRFILFGGEEQGLHGSLQYVASLSAEERNLISAAVNMDMIGTLNTQTPGVLIEGAPVSQTVIDGLAAAAASYTRLEVRTSLRPYNSDHVPFIDAGVPGVLTIEGADSSNQNIHSANDTLAHINYDLALDILRMNVAFAALTAGRGEEGP